MQITCVRKEVCKDFEIKRLGEYHDLYLKNDKLRFGNFRKMCLTMYHLDPTKFLSVQGLAWQAALRKIWIINAYWKDYDKMISLEMKKNNTTLTEKLRKNLHYH